MTELMWKKGNSSEVTNLGQESLGAIACLGHICSFLLMQNLGITRLKNQRTGKQIGDPFNNAGTTES